MSSKRKNLKGMNAAEMTHELSRRIRGDWNGINPVTKVFKDKTKYTRKTKHKNRDYSETGNSLCFLFSV